MFLKAPVPRLFVALTLGIAVSDVAVASTDAVHSVRCITQRSDPVVIHRTVPVVANTTTRPQRKAVLTVVVSQDGLVQSVAILQSSGVSQFDAAAIAATEATAFAPAARQCVAIGSAFQYTLGYGASGALQTAVVRNSSTHLVTADR